VSEHIEVGAQSIELSRPDKILFPRDGITKRDLAHYYRRVAETMLPHLQDRPLVMHRFPDGIEGPDFYQQDAPDHFPDWIRRETVPKEEGEVTHVVCDEATTLVYLADQACITFHAWLSTSARLDQPDRLVFDLDPPEKDRDLAPVRFAARAVRDLLDELGLGSRLMTTGSAGFHVVVPLDGVQSFDEVRGFAHRCADLLAGRHPDRLTVEQRITRRAGRVFLDYLRNAYGQTTVAPYSVRARPGAPIATPIDWGELPAVAPRTYTLNNLFRRLGQKDDPWATDDLGAQSLDRPFQRLEDLES